jgi:hypothetical protein
MREYDLWAEGEASRIAGELRTMAMRGDFGAAVYFIPASGSAWARLVLAHEQPEGATDCVRFPGSSGMTSRVACVAYQHLAAGIRDACRRLPVYPVAAPSRAPTLSGAIELARGLARAVPRSS